MSLASLFPATRATTDTFGPDKSNDDPVADPTRELDASEWNRLKAEVGALCSVAPLAILIVANNGSTASIVTALGPLSGAATVARTGTGVVRVTMPVAVIVKAAIPVGTSLAVPDAVPTNVPGTTNYVDITTANPAGAATDGGFVVALY